MTLIRTDTRPGVTVAFYDNRLEADTVGATYNDQYGKAIIPQPVLGRDPGYDYEDNQLGYWLYAVVIDRGLVQT